MVIHSVACESDFSQDNGFALYASRNGVSLVGVQAVVLYAHSTLGSSFGHIPFAPLSQVLMILGKDQFVTSTCPLT